MKKALLFVAAICFFIAGYTQPNITFRQMVTGLSNPVDVVEENNDSARLFIAEKTGRIRIVKDSTLLIKPFLNVSSLVTSSGERGLLSMAFHPQYAANGYFFIYYTNLNGSVVIARYRRSTPDSADPASATILMTIPKPYANHNGGKLNFGPDGYLYFGLGDGGSGGDPNNNAQNNTTWLGKMLRIDVNDSIAPFYKIPPTNPFFGSTSFKQEIIANGLRNPWRWSFDKVTNDMWIADVGQNLWEEVNVVPFADRLDKNYGWRCYEGTHVYNNTCSAQVNNVYPIFDYPHTDTSGGYSVTGGYVYRGVEFPTLQGYYLFADYVTGNGWLTKSNGAGGWTTTIQHNWLLDISSFGERADGTLYVTQLSGKLYKVIASNTLSVRLVSFNGNESNNRYTLQWTVANEEKGDLYVIEKRSKTNEAFKTISSNKAATDKPSNTYSLKIDLPVDESFFRLKVIAASGQISYSQIVRYAKSSTAYLKAYAVGNVINILPPANTNRIVLIDEMGRVLWQQNKTSLNMVQVPVVGKGVFTVRAFVNGDWEMVRVVK